MKLSPSDAKNLEICIQELELRTSAEVVLVIRESSGNYRDLAHLAGAFFAWLTLLIAMSIPMEIPEYWLPLPMAAVFWIASYAVMHSRLRTLFATENRKSLQVTKAAHACFYEKKIHQTSAHSGILIYCSLFERRAEIVMDQVAERSLDAAKIDTFKNQLMSDVCGPQARTEGIRGLSQFLRTFGVYLGGALPALGAIRTNELENAPDFGPGELS